MNVVEVDGKIVAYWPIIVTVHVEPLWISPEHRHNRQVAKLLVQQVFETLKAEGITLAFGMIADEDFVQNFPMAAKLGFQKAPGDLYFIQVPEE